MSSTEYYEQYVYHDDNQVGTHVRSTCLFIRLMLAQIMTVRSVVMADIVTRNDIRSFLAKQLDFRPATFWNQRQPMITSQPAFGLARLQPGMSRRWIEPPPLVWRPVHAHRLKHANRPWAAWGQGPCHFHHHMCMQTLVRSLCLQTLKYGVLCTCTSTASIHCAAYFT